jgi:hypothetical protein
MGKYLRSTGGIYRNELRSEWELEKVAQLLSHNNAAERPFAIAKAYLKSFPTMKLSTLANFALALTNGTHRPAGTQGKTKKTKARATPPAGIAVTSPAVLKVAVTKFCGVRVIKPGTVTQLLRELNTVNVVRADELRRANQKAELDRKARQHSNKSIVHNRNMEEELVGSKANVEAHLAALGNATGASLNYLKRQFDARVAWASSNDWNYPSIGPNFRTKDGKKLKKTPSNGEDKVSYLKSLVVQMIKADSRRRQQTVVEPLLTGLVRKNPVINLASTDPVSLRAKGNPNPTK